MTNEICPHCQLPRQGAHSCMDSMRAEIERLEGIQKDFHNLDDLEEIKRLRNIVTGCPVCSELERNIQPSHAEKPL